MNKVISLLIASISQRSVQSIMLIILYLIYANHLNMAQNQFLLTISLIIKDCLLLIIPLVVCVFIANTITAFRKQAVLFVLTIVIFEWCSNFLSVWYTYICAQFLTGSSFDFASQPTLVQLEPLWRIPVFMPEWWTASKGCFAGLILGCICALFNLPKASKWISRLKVDLEWCLRNIFSRLIPLFILGFLASAYHNHLLTEIIRDAGIMLLFLVSILLVYIAALFILGNLSKPTKALTNIKNLLPAGSIALMSGCSLSTMPFTIEGTAKNLKNPKLASAIIPATTNIQQIGDCIASTFVAYFILVYFTGTPPTSLLWLQFSLVYVLARFATAAVLGGAIFIMIPIYEAYLGFTPEMIALVLAFNVILDPLITSSNVMANGALCKIFENFWNLIRKVLKIKEQSSLKTKST